MLLLCSIIGRSAFDQRSTRQPGPQPHFNITAQVVRVLSSTSQNRSTASSVILIKNAFLTFPHLYFYRSDNVYY
jgi:hypothetical protein